MAGLTSRHAIGGSPVFTCPFGPDFTPSRLGRHAVAACPVTLARWRLPGDARPVTPARWRLPSADCLVPTA